MDPYSGSKKAKMGRINSKETKFLVCGEIFSLESWRFLSELGNPSGKV
jgi:hypothetical protein